VAPRSRHTFVLSDVHLAEADPGDGAWMRYRQRRWFPDDDLRRLVAVILSTTRPGDELDLVFGGDVFEFEGPPVIDGEVRFEDRPRTEAEAVATFERIAGDHQDFFAAIGQVLDAGHRIVFVIGNHDVQLVFPAVQAALRRAIARHTRVPLEALEERVCVRPWFFQTDDGIHVEHGHQYDAYCSFRDPLRPLAPGGDEIHPTVGSVAFRHLVSRMGFFNAYDERSYMLSFPRYLMHWARHYLPSGRSLVRTWFFGAVRVVRIVLRSRPARHAIEIIRREAAVARAAFAETFALDREAVERHASLFAPPADEDPHRVIREMRLDRAALAAVAVAGLVASAFRPRLGLALAAGAILTGIVRELIEPHRGVESEYRRLQGVAKEIAQIYRARAVVFGHTHIPLAGVDDGILVANTGAWTPQAPSADEPEEPHTPWKGRPVVWLRREVHTLSGGRSPRIEGGLYRLLAGGIVAEREVALARGESVAAEAGARISVATP
jgi:UDP-2,3-diacylglucosamine pyrophosphatase LpxH